jgi:hypothetical protein
MAANGGMVCSSLEQSLPGSEQVSLPNPRVGRVTAVVVGYVVILIVAYFLVGQTASRYAPSGPQGGPNVMPRR